MILRFSWIIFIAMLVSNILSMKIKIIGTIRSFKLLDARISFESLKFSVRLFDSSLVYEFLCIYAEYQRWPHPVSSLWAKRKEDETHVSTFCRDINSQQEPNRMPLAEFKRKRGSKKSVVPSFSLNENQATGIVVSTKSSCPSRPSNPSWMIDFITSDGLKLSSSCRRTQNRKERGTRTSTLILISRAESHPSCTSGFTFLDFLVSTVKLRNSILLYDLPLDARTTARRKLYITSVLYTTRVLGNDWSNVREKNPTANGKVGKDSSRNTYAGEKRNVFGDIRKEKNSRRVSRLNYARLLEALLRKAELVPRRVIPSTRRIFLLLNF